MPRDVSRARNMAPAATEGDPLDEFARPAVSPDAPEVTGGWAEDKGAPEVRRADAVPQFKVADETEVPFKFLQSRPFASGFQHWLPVIGKPGAFYPVICLVKDCPLCKRGHKPKEFNFFNVADMSETDDQGNSAPMLKVWYASPDPSSAIKQASKRTLTSPLDKEGLYFIAYKVMGKNDIPSYHIDKVTEDELRGSFGVEPLTDEQITALLAQAYGPDIVQGRKSREELAELARNLKD